jgi:ABC-type cobalt transport system substrate-binding protein
MRDEEKIELEKLIMQLAETEHAESALAILIFCIAAIGIKKSFPVNEGFFASADESLRRAVKTMQEPIFRAMREANGTKKH